MSTLKPSAPLLSPPPNGASPSTALDDFKLQFATEEVRKRFSAISMTDMLAVLSMLLTDPRIRECAREQTSGALKVGIHGLPFALELKRSDVSACGGRNSASRLRQPASVRSFTTAKLSPQDWCTRSLEMSEAPTLHAPAASWLSQEWTTTITSILDNASQHCEFTDEHCTVVERVQLSIKEWFEDASVEAVEREKVHAATDSDAYEDPAWLSTLTQVRHLAEAACYSKYAALYQRLCSEAEDESDEGMVTPAYVQRDDDSAKAPSSVMARWSAHRAATGPVGIPPFSLVIQCGSGGGGAGASTPSLNFDLEARNGGTRGSGLDSSGASFVVGCEWFQWVFLVQSLLTCQSAPYPGLEGGAADRDAEALAAEQEKWQQRHCTVQLLYPSEAGFSDGSDGSSGLRSAEAEYELSEPHTVLSSLLGVAMRVWCQSHPHIVAHVLQLEEDTYPRYIYDGSLFWSVWPLSDLAILDQCECTAASATMPIPLLPGECFAHELGSGGEERG
ncbi:hypothetical protein GH5_00988 [Leishmania sp. Ghana 2012 LV757]|uniref:hypothetical protein n=1 Tax=Leishmania sp. Ghana 2012 LV757 TaxID=2803181 RepID=UPI001B42DDB6|nr:hypothetical protein GH5_00988 [Leishmania sp. Ghana 2012 LV757]